VAGGGVESLERSLACLDAARRALESFLAAARRAGPAPQDARPKLASVATSLRRLRTRLALAGEYYEGWLRLRATLSGGYGPAGTTPPQPEGTRLLAEG
jgi:hypothetical protein